MQHLDEGRLQEWLDRPRSGMDAREAAEIERHLEECRECARRLSELEDLDARADSILSSVVPKDTSVPEYREGVARSRRSDGARRGRRIGVGLAWAASLVLALGVGWVANELARDGGMAMVERPARLEAPSDSALAGPVATAEEGESREETERPRPAAPTAPAAEATEPSRTRVVRGRVTDEEGRPLQAAQVVVSGGEAGSVTDRDGTFSVELPEALASADSGVSLTAEHIGYGSDTRRIAEGTGDTVSATFRLREQAVSLEALTVTGADRAAPDLATVWSPVSREAAEEEAGFAVLTVPGLELVGLEIGSLDGAPAVRLRQTVEPGTVITVVQRRARGATVAANQPDGVSTVSVRKGDLLLTATAPLPADSLRALLARAR